jgi:hypothetical protein
VAFNPSHDLIIRWSNAQPGDVARLKSAGIGAVVTEGAAEPLRAAGIETFPADRLPALPLKEYAARAAGLAALREGLWPGVTRPPEVRGRGDETASASREPWVDANGFWIYYLRALFPGRPALLGYEADFKERVVPYSSLELALIEARVAGGNCVLSIDPRYRQALLAGDANALRAWKSLAGTAAWLRSHAALWGQPVFPAITLLVDEGPETAELANLMFRRNASPAVASAADPPPPDPARRQVVVAAGLRTGLTPRILAHAQAGATVLTDAKLPQVSLKLSRGEPDRNFYTLGKGRLIAYKEAVADPSEFALDAIDAVTHRRRAARLWNAPAAVLIASACPENSPVRGRALLLAINYGEQAAVDFPARIQGHFGTATLLRPEAPPAPLKTARRGSMTEVFFPELNRLGVVVFG